MSQDSRIISALSRQYIIIPIEGKDDNGTIDPTAFPVEFAFLLQDGIPAVDTIWYAGTWFTETQAYLPDIYKAKVLIGPSGQVALTPGSWDVWVRVTHTVEQPIEKADTILIV